MSEQFQNAEQLENALSEPTPEVIETMRWLKGDVLLLGVAGKMGPSLARMVKRASEMADVPRRVTGVARFTNTTAESALQAHGIDTIRCDLLDEEAVASLPDAPNVIYLAGMKFGATGQEALTWAMNTWLPSVVCARYPGSRIVAFSTGNVYGLVPVDGGGSRESDTPQPVGEYAMSCLGRERMFEHFGHYHECPTVLIRLNYACDLRYGVLVDLAQKVWAGRPVDVTMGHFNTIWQGDANALSLLAFRHAAVPPFVVNLTGPELLTVRDVCERLGRRMGKDVGFIGREAESALLSNSQRAFDLLARPRMSAEELIDRVAAWVMRGGESLGKPTHFESRDGKF
jgi:nucleoside-diphosphate-sugar epimerase